MLAKFQPVCRYEIRAALRAAYEIRVSDSAQDFATLWPMFERLYERKGFRSFRPLAGWMEMISRASAIKCARIYSASQGARTVQAILVVRDARRAEYMLGALDVEQLGKNPSPACLLHWHAMQDVRRLGCTAYDLGPPSGPVYQFKRKFRPVSHVPPQPVTIATSPLLYRLWTTLGLRGAWRVWPTARSLFSKALRRSQSS
jgi:hypothetical protein